MTKNGACFFNFGGSCVSRLMVALFTMRKFYNGPVTVFLAKNDRFNEQILDDLKEQAVDVIWFDLEAIAKRNMKCVIKPTLFKMSPYKNTLMFDGDLVFQADISPLFAPLEANGFLVTRFSTWNTDGGKMSKRIAKFKAHLTPAEWEIASSADVAHGKVAAVNIGVMGWSHGHQIMERWQDLTLKVAGQHMADEHAAQVLYPLYIHYLADAVWNQSCVFPSDPDYTKAKVVHFHGNKESEPSRGSSRIWLKALEELARSGEVRQLTEYLVWHGESVLANVRRAGILRDPAVTFEVKP